MATNVDISDGFAIRNRIQGWTRDRDNTYSMIVLLGTWVEFSNVPIPGALTKADGTAYIVGVDYPIPIRSNTRVEPLSHATYFDNQPLRSRSESYQKLAINWFAEATVGIQLNPYKGVGHESDNGEGGRNKPLPLSTEAMELCLNILSGSLEDYLADPATFVYKNYGAISDSDEQRYNETVAFIKVGKENPDLVREANNVVELGRADGDHDVYILIGIDHDTRIPDPSGLKWYMEQIEKFIELNSFLPEFGYFVSEANRRYRVVLGPGCTDREKQFLEHNGHRVFDMRDGRPFEGPLPDPFESIYKK